MRQICNVELQDTVSIRSSELLAWLGIENLNLILKERRLCLYGGAARHCHHQVTIRSNELLAWLGTEDLDLILKEKVSAGMDMLNTTVVQSRQSVTYNESVGLGNPR